MSNVAIPLSDEHKATAIHEAVKSSLAPPSKTASGRASDSDSRNSLGYKTDHGGHALHGQTRDGVGAALTDTPATTAPNSPRM